jgi:hypothetical protein
MLAPNLARGPFAAGKLAWRTVSWPVVGAVLGGAALGVYGILYSLIWAALTGEFGSVSSTIGGLVLAGAAAGGLTGACASLLDGHNPLSRDDPLKDSAASPKILRSGARGPVLPDTIRARLSGLRPPVDH